MTVALTLATLLGGAVLGYGARLYEFKREQRRDAYVRLASAFLATTRSGAALFTAAIQLGEKVRSKEYGDQMAPRWAEWRSASHEFDVALASVTLIGSQKARKEAEALDAFVASNVRAVPPFTSDADGAKGWGESAKVGPAEVSEEAVRLAQRFASTMRPEIARWRLPK